MLLQEPLIIFGFALVPIVSIIPSITFFIIFLRNYIRTRQKMFGYLAILFISYLSANFFQTMSSFSPNLQNAELSYLLYQLLEMLTLYSLVIVLETFDKQEKYTRRQIILTMLVFIVVGGIITNPLLISEQVGQTNKIHFDSFSPIVLIKATFNLLTSVWLIIMLNQSYKSAWSQKQKKLIKRLSIGLIIVVFLPSGSYILELTLGRELFESIGRELLNGLFLSIGMLIIGVAFIRISKNPWLLQRQRAQVLMVYSHGGLLLYSKSFSKDVNPDDLTLLSGGFTAVSSLIKEATKSSGQVKAILLEGKELRIFSRKTFLCALLVEYNTQASELAHKKFTEMFESRFSEQLNNFSGEISQFREAEVITEQFFS